MLRYMYSSQYSSSTCGACGRVFKNGKYVYMYTDDESEMSFKMCKKCHKKIQKEKGGA